MSLNTKYMRVQWQAKQVNLITCTNIDIVHNLWYVRNVFVGFNEMSVTFWFPVVQAVVDRCLKYVHICNITVGILLCDEDLARALWIFID